MGLYRQYWRWMSGASRPVRALFHVGIATVGLLVIASVGYGFKPGMFAVGAVAFVVGVVMWFRLDDQP